MFLFPVESIYVSKAWPFQKVTEELELAVWHRAGRGNLEWR